MPKDKNSDCRRAGFQPGTASTCSVPTSKFYRQFILEASRSPKYRGKIEETGLRPGEKVVRLEGSNPSCGDQLTLYLKIAVPSPSTLSTTAEGISSQKSEFQAARILDARFEGSGCAISMASAHFLCENIIGKATDEAQEYVAGYLKSIDAGTPNPVYAPLDNVAQMPARVECARLAWGVIFDRTH
ncbi:iron-sulfur cluster assembly scaffold protein [Candidatus Saccharibacteria bacterium]|nr:iron-sulfur cluster assembly scaffold protein [Candidatus Saccharibacteria bacterium]